MSSITVISGDLLKNPKCKHGPTALFARLVDGKEKKFYACSACRDRKDCNFFLWHNDLSKIPKTKKDVWLQEAKRFVYGINHHNLYLTYLEILNTPPRERMYCRDCSSFQLKKYKHKHKDHEFVENISDDELKRPSEFLKPLEDPKMEAQFLFNKESVKTIVQILKNLNYKNVLCIGAPRIHEYIINECSDMSSLLLDIDRRLHDFYNPLQFCWYNSFNHHFFLEKSLNVFKDFMENDNLVLVMDPPFGGRVELLADNVNKIQAHTDDLLPMFWIFPYFMEPQIVNSIPNFQMLDYKVGYDNHPLFNNQNGRKQGSPVRIFTNLCPGLIKLPKEEGYKFCKKCSKWVAEENQHCDKCKACTSKDGRTYVHCKLCRRCVKPTWKHCNDCGRCGQEKHSCGIIEFNRECFHCKKNGHKRSECPDATTIKSKKLKKLP